MQLIENQSVATLRKAGFKVKVCHERYNHEGVLYPRYTYTFSHELSPKGGRTSVFVTTPEGKNYTGISKCSRKDSFNRKLGLKIALGRLEETKENIN